MELKENPVIATWKTIIEVAGGSDTRFTYLSCSADGTIIDLWDVIDNPNCGRQVWVFYMIASHVFNIIISGGTQKGATFLSSSRDGKQLDLVPKDDGSGRQRWTLNKVSDGVYNIKIFGGTLNDSTFLSCKASQLVPGLGNVVYLQNTDDGSGRQRWKLQNIPLIDVSFSIDNGRILQNTPEVIASQEVVNRTTIAQSMSFQVAQTVEEKSFFETSQGVSMTVGTTFESGVPFVGDVSINFSLTASFQQTFGKEVSKSKTITATFPVAAPAGKKVVCDAIVTKSKLQVPYSFTFADGTVQQGMWYGVSAWGLNSEFNEMAVPEKPTEEEEKE